MTYRRRVYQMHRYPALKAPFRTETGCQPPAPARRRNEPWPAYESRSAI